MNQHIRENAVRVTIDATTWIILKRVLTRQTQEVFCKKRKRSAAFSQLQDIDFSCETAQTGCHLQSISGVGGREFSA